MTFILGMAGGTASGKTTLAEAVHGALGSRAVLVTHDRYYHSLPATYRNNPVAYNFDHPDALDTERLVADIDCLRRGDVAELPIYDFPNHSRAPHVETVQPAEVVIVEGILVLADPALRERMDHAIYVHTPDDIRLVRRIRRDVQKRGRTALQVLDQYEATVRPMHEAYVAPSRAHADLVLSGTEPLADLVDAVLAILPTARS